MKKITLILIILTSIYSQWKLNPKENTLLATTSSDPFNIQLNTDASGGFYITWQENVANTDNINTLHYTKELKADFRTDGIPVTSSILPKLSYTTSTIANDLIVTWIETVDDTNKVFLQRLTPQGKLLFGEKGKVIFENSSYKEAFSTINSKKNILVAALGINNKIYFSAFNSRGEILPFFENLAISTSNSTKSKLKVIPVPDGGTYILWIEKSGLNAKLYGQYVSPKAEISWFRKSWQKSPYLISNVEKDILDYEAFTTENNELIVIAETKEQQGKISIRKFNNFGVATTPDNQIFISTLPTRNMKAVIENNLIQLTYLELQDNSYKLKLSTYNIDENKIKHQNVNILTTNDPNLVYTTIGDDASGIYILWLTKTKNDEIIKVQRVNDLGKIVYDQDGITVSNKPRSIKSYIIPFFFRNELTFIFKDSYNNQATIYGDQLQKPDIKFEFLSFEAYSYDNKEVILEWSTIGEKNGKGFTVERQINNGNWQAIGFVPSFNKIDKADYNFKDNTTQSGIYKYRIFWTNFFAQKIYSDIATLRLGSDDLNTFLLYQNEPNPASTQTVIKFYAPYRAKVKITIIKDLKPVQVIFDDFCEKGDNILPPLDLTNFENGVYIIQMRTSDYIEIKKMVVQK